MVDERDVRNSSLGIDHFVSISSGCPLPAGATVPSPVRSMFGCNGAPLFINASNANSSGDSNVTLSLQVGRLLEVLCDVGGFTPGGAKIDGFYRALFILFIVAIFVFAVLPSFAYGIGWIIKYFTFQPPPAAHPPPAAGASA